MFSQLRAYSCTLFSTDGHDGSPFRNKTKREKEGLYDGAQRTGKLGIHSKR